MDLDAPALPELLGCESDVRDDQGVAELLMALDQGKNWEWEPLLETLKSLGRTPILAADLREQDDRLVFLAREVGLAVYEESGDEIIRYTVPDLYRYGLKMTRKGQA